MIVVLVAVGREDRLESASGGAAELMGILIDAAAARNGLADVWTTVAPHRGFVKTVHRNLRHQECFRSFPVISRIPTCLNCSFKIESGREP